MLSKVVSGGQTGVDRAALDAAREAGVPSGGWCPQGRRAEDGTIPDRYPLVETPSAEYDQRTEWNVRDSDGTLVLRFAARSGGTDLTVTTAHRLGRSVLVLDAPDEDGVDRVAEWVLTHQIRVLNVAGPRASEAPEAYPATLRFLKSLFHRIRASQ